MEIGGLQKSTLIDYPGQIACTVFLIGCNFRCPWCYSPELVLPDEIMKQLKISEKDFFDFLEKRKNLLGGVVVCGGEPTINFGLLEFISRIKIMGFKVKLDTNGSNPEMLKKLIKEKLIDYIAMDIKAPLRKENYEKLVGTKINLKEIKESIKVIKNSGIDYEFRTTVIPDFHTKKDIVEIVENISPAKKYFLQDFRPEKNLNSCFKEKEPYGSDFLKKIVKEISSSFEECDSR